MPSGNLQDRAQDRQLLKSPFTFKQVRPERHRSQRDLSQVGAVADDVCVIRSMYTDRPNHEPSLFMLNCGEKMPGGQRWAPG